MHSPYISLTSPPIATNHSVDSSLQKQLLVAATDASVGGRQKLGQMITNLFESGLSATVQEQAGLLLQEMLPQMERLYRRELAERLAKVRGVPPRLIYVLATDTIDVAEHVLAKCLTLSEEDLVSIIGSTAAPHWRVISGRADLTGRVCQTLIQTKEEQTLIHLLNNEAAPLSTSMLEDIVQHSANVPSLHEPILGRKVLPEGIAAKIYVWVSEELKQTIESRFVLQDDILEIALKDALTSVMVKHSFRHKTTALMEKWAQSASRLGRQTSQLLVEVLRQGHQALFLCIASNASGIGVDRLRNIILNKEAYNLALCCRVIAMSKSQFASIYLLSMADLSPITKRQDTDKAPALATILDYYDRLERSNIEKMLKDLRG